MNKIEIQRLSVKELPLIEDLLMNQINLLKMPKRAQTIEQYLSTINYRLNEDRQHFFIYGAFLENQLVAMAGALFGKKTAVWTLSYVHTRKLGLNNFYSAMGQVIDVIIEYAEQQEIFRFEFASQGDLSLLMRISGKSKRYNYYTEANVLKNTKPQFEYHWLLLGKQLQEADVVIKAGELKEEFRTSLVDKIHAATKSMAL